MIECDVVLGCSLRKDGRHRKCASSANNQKSLHRLLKVYAHREDHLPQLKFLGESGNGLSTGPLSPRNNIPSDFGRSQETRRLLPGAFGSVLLFCRKPASCDALRSRLVFARSPANLRSRSVCRQVNHPHQIGSQMARANCDRYQPADHRPAAFGGVGKHSGHQPASRGVCPTGCPLATSLEKSFAHEPET